MLFSTKDALALDALLREAAHAEILPRFRRLSTDAVRHKSSAHDLVTDADEAAEAFVTARLRRQFPQAVIVGEEAAAKDPAILDRLKDADLAFVLDPVDGTKNFASGLTLFAIMAAVVVRGEVVAGVIHDPVGGDTALAVRGEGAWIQGAEDRQADLRVSAPPASIAQASACASLHYLPRETRASVGAKLAQLAVAVCYRCCAHEFRLLAAGHYDFAFYSKLLPWDIAAGWLLHREAGGYAARVDGTPYSATSAEGRLICAPDEASWHALREALFAP
ncbi:MAG TPA: inositol monophosphatase [Microvirga sp.]|jgi:fructose-1,6-bisphosphatase/inositol monophosphatase family enzyme|nr:inositol monophosphatase [Microvirga sp.]